jgi:hypothetical protein
MSYILEITGLFQSPYFLKVLQVLGLNSQMPKYSPLKSCHQTEFRIIGNGNWFHKRIPPTNDDAPGQTDKNKI